LAEGLFVFGLNSAPDWSVEHPLPPVVFGHGPSVGQDSARDELPPFLLRHFSLFQAFGRNKSYYLA